MRNFVECDRDQAFLLPPDLRDWLPADDLGHFVIEAVERVDLGAFKVNHRGTGSAQYHPRMMLALMIYCYASGIFSSRRSRLQNSDRFGAAQEHPNWQRRPRTAIGAILMATMVGSALAQPPIRYFRRTSGAFGRTVFREVRPP